MHPGALMDVAAEESALALSVSQVARKLNASERFVWGQIAKGELRSFICGGRLRRIALSDLLDYIDQHREG